MLTDPDCISIAQCVINLQSKLDASAQTIATLQNSMNQPILSSYRTFSALESQAGWRLGTGAGTGAAAGKDAPGAWTVEGDSAVVTISPTKGYQNSYWYRDFTEFPAATVRRFSHRVEYLLPADCSPIQQLENECKYWDGQWVWDMAWAACFNLQDKPNGGFWCVFNYGHAAGEPGWVPTKIPLVYTPGQWLTMQAEFLIDPITGNKTHLGVWINGTWNAVNWSQKAVQNTSQSRFLTSAQLDSNSQGVGYQLSVRNALAWV